jgi:hypothetical protein
MPFGSMFWYVPDTWPALTHSASSPNRLATSTRDSRRASNSCVSVGFQDSGFASTSALVTIGERTRWVSIALAFSSVACAWSKSGSNDRICIVGTPAEDTPAACV